MKIKFSSDYDLPLNKSLKFRLMTITIRHVFEENGTLYPQDDTLYELNIIDDTSKELIFQKVLILIKQINQKKVCFVIIGIF